MTLYKLMNHLIEIKKLISEREDLRVTREYNVKREEETMAIFKKRQQQIKLLTAMAMLKKIQKYSQNLSVIMSDRAAGKDNDDVTRLKGLQQVEFLRQSLIQVQRPPDFKRSGSQAPQVHTQVESGQASDTHTFRDQLASVQRSVCESAATGNTHSQGQSCTKEGVELMQALEHYIENKAKYDRFYQEYFKMVCDIDFGEIDKTNVQSNTRMLSLQYAFRLRENEKNAKLLQLRKLEKYLNLL